jgi:hypothetical protein
MSKEPLSTINQTTLNLNCIEDNRNLWFSCIEWCTITTKRGKAGELKLLTMQIFKFLEIDKVDALTPTNSRAEANGLCCAQALMGDANTGLARSNFQNCYRLINIALSGGVDNVV